MKPAVDTAVNMCAAAEDGLRQHAFHFSAGPVGRPVVEEFQLSLSQEHRSGHVHRFGIIVGVEDVIRSRSLLWNKALGARLELTVLDDGETDSPDVQRGIINSDAALDGCRVVRVGQMACLGAFDLLDVPDGGVVSTVVAGTGVGLLATGAPQIGLADVVIVRDGDRGNLTDDLAEVLAEPQPVLEMLGVVIDLVAAEEQQVGPEPLDVFDDVGLGQVSAVSGHDAVAGECRHGDDILVGGVPQNPAVEECTPAVGDAIVNRLCRIPVFHPERRSPAVLDDLCGGYLFPFAVLFYFQPHSPRVVVCQRIELGGELEYVIVYGVQGKTNLLVFWNLRDIPGDVPGLEILRVLSISPALGGRVTARQGQHGDKDESAPFYNGGGNRSGMVAEVFLLHGTIPRFSLEYITG